MQEHSGCAEGDLTEIQRDNSTWNCSSQVWSEQKMCQLCKPYQTQEQGKCNEVVETCMRDRRDLMIEGKMRAQAVRGKCYHYEQQVQDYGLYLALPLGQLLVFSVWLTLQTSSPAFTGYVPPSESSLHWWLWFTKLFIIHGTAPHTCLIGWPRCLHAVSESTSSVVDSRPTHYLSTVSCYNWQTIICCCWSDAMKQSPQ